MCGEFEDVIGMFKKEILIGILTTDESRSESLPKGELNVMSGWTEGGKDWVLIRGL